MARIEYELRNVPHFRLREYWVEAGGTLIGDFSAEGDGWTIRLEPLDAVHVGKCRVPCDKLIIEGEEAAVDIMAAFMRGKTMRGGG